MLLYLHGFLSSPRSTKANLMAARLAALGRTADWSCPQLEVAPAAAARQIETLARAVPAADLCVVGSSLGGFYATWLAERLGCRAALLNPAVHPDRDLAGHLGVRSVYYSDEQVEILPEFLGQLQALKVARITRPERYFLIAATGDEVLDWREMTAHYAGAAQCVIEGSDHGLSDFPDHLDEVLRFAGILAPAAVAGARGCKT